jgi:hypothetical protein
MSFGFQSTDIPTQLSVRNIDRLTSLSVQSTDIPALLSVQNTDIITFFNLFIHNIDIPDFTCSENSMLQGGSNMSV